MKIEVSFVELEKVLRKMGIENETGDLLERRGIEITSLNEIDVDPQNGCTLLYKGHTIVVYIRDQRPEYFGNYKFHVSNCKTLQNMKREGRYSRYVLSTRTDGKFRVYDKTTKHDRFVELLVCENCLKFLNWKRCRGYADIKKFVREFSLEEFFKKYDESPVPELPPQPRHTDIGGPTNDYSPHQAGYSYDCRERAGWKCENCGIFLGRDDSRKFLHTHHIDRDQSNNHLSNLRALCVDCHNKQAGHSLPANMLREFHDWKRQRISI